MTTEKKKAPNVLQHVEGENRKTNPYQEEEITMNTTVPRIPAHFETAINVAGLIVAPNQLVGGGEADENVVTLHTREELLSFSPAEACALAAALQAVAVHLMEQNQAVAA